MPRRTVHVGGQAQALGRATNIGELTIDYDRHRVTKAGREVTLTPTEYASWLTSAASAQQLTFISQGELDFPLDCSSFPAHSNEFVTGGCYSSLRLLVVCTCYRKARTTDGMKANTLRTLHMSVEQPTVFRLIWRTQGLLACLSPGLFAA